MRTTVTLDADTEQLLRERMRTKGVSFKQALNDAVRDGLGVGTVDYSTPVFSMGVPTVDLTKALSLAGELEDEKLVRALRRGA